MVADPEGEQLLERSLQRMDLQGYERQPGLTDRDVVAVDGIERVSALACPNPPPRSRRRIVFTPLPREAEPPGEANACGKRVVWGAERRHFRSGRIGLGRVGLLGCALERGGLLAEFGLAQIR